MKDCEAGIPAEAWCSNEEKDKKSQYYCVDVGDVEVVRVLCYSAASGKRKRA